MTWKRSDLPRRSVAKTDMSRRPVRRSLGGGGSPWTKAEIRAARQTALKPVLEDLGYRLEPRNNDNYLVLGLPEEIVVKEHYWVCLDDGSAGNAIDFLVRVEGMTFKKAMELLLS